MYQKVLLLLIGVFFVHWSSAQVTLTGKVHFPEGTSCSPLSPIEGVAIQIDHLGNSTTTNTTTNISGEFSASIATGKIRITPSFPASSNWENGVSGFDGVTLTRHIERVSRIDCPFRRIAADVNNDGILDTMDVSLITDLTLNALDSFPDVPNWRFVSKNYTMTGEYTNDMEFSSDFWNTDYTDENGNDYPMSANYTHSHILKYPYRDPTAGGEEIWMEKLNEGQLSSIALCDAIDWGFYAVKSGDVNGNALLNSFTSGEEEVAKNYSNGSKIIVDYQFTDSSGEIIEFAELRSSKKYHIVLEADITEAVIAYQLGININQDNISLLSLHKGKHFDQPNKRTFSWKPEVGDLRIIWMPKDLKKKLSKQTTLFGLTIQTKKAIKNLSELIQLKDKILPNQFFDEEGNEVALNLTIKVIELPNN